MASSNKRIVKNTMVLYLRMIVSLVISLFTTRVVLQTLGVSDYGVYNVVGGFVAMLSYINSVFIDANQRFITFSLGEGDLEKLKRVFNTSILTQCIYVIVLLVIAETFGLWFINHKLVIGPDRIVAANWVYQCSVGSLLLTVSNIPYRACIIAHEKMGIYAYITIMEVVMKLVIVFLLVVIPADKLIVYALLYFIVSFVIPVWFHIYCLKNFPECRFRFKFDKSIFKEMFSFSGWVLIGNLGFSFKDQFSNILMNVFLGTTVNAARGIAGKVNGIVTGFVNNYMMAMSPQITKQYAVKDYEGSKKLVYTGCKFAFYLMLIMGIPVVANVDYLLCLWLGVVPEYTSSFIVITIIASMFYAMSKPLTTAIQATGDIKGFQIGIAIIMLLELPVAYIVLKLDYSPIWAIVPAILTNIIGVFFRFYLLCKDNAFYNMGEFFTNVFVKCVGIFSVVYPIAVVFNHIFKDNLLGTLLSLFCALLFTLSVVFLLGFDRSERQSIVSLIKKTLHR